MAINTISNTSSQQLTVVNGPSAVSAGDLIMQTEGGQIFPTPTLLPLSQINNTTAGLSAITAWANLAPNANYSFYREEDNAVELGNGLIAVAYTGDGTTTNTSVKVRITTDAGAQQNLITPATTAGLTSVRVKKLTATTFVVAWSDGTLNFRIYNNDGTAVTAATVVSSMATGTTTNWSFAITANSDIVFVYGKVTSNNVNFSRYNSSGVLQGVETTIEAGGNPNYVNVLALAAGGFWVYYRRAAATQAFKFARYDSTGTLQGTLTTVVTNGNNFALNAQNAIYELSNGNVLLFAPATTGSWPDAYIYDSSGTLVLSNTTWHGSAATIALAQHVPGVLVKNGGFAMAVVTSGSNVVIYELTNAFVINIGPNTVRDSGGSPLGFSINNGANYGAIHLLQDGSLSYTIAILGTTTTPASNSSIVSINSVTYRAIGSLTTLYSSGSAVNAGSAFLTSKGTLVFASQSTTPVGAYVGFYSMSRRSIIGVAQNSAAAGGTVSCATTGTFTINNPPLSPGYFDNRTATPGGCRGTIAGTTAILSGTV